MQFVISRGVFIYTPRFVAKYDKFAKDPLNHHEYSLK